MKYLFLTIFFLASFAVSACGQIVFPSPNQVEMQKGYLTLRKKISIYAEDTTTFYLSLFRTEVLLTLLSNGRRKHLKPKSTG